MPTGVYKRTKEIRKKQSERMKGHSGFWKGKKLTKEHRKRISKSKMGKSSGKDNYGWRGGCWVYWRKRIVERDDYTCQVCGLKDRDIVEVAHIEPVNGQDNRHCSGNPLNSLENLICLCPNDHRRFDKGIITKEDLLWIIKNKQ